MESRHHKSVAHFTKSHCVPHKISRDQEGVDNFLLIKIPLYRRVGVEGEEYMEFIGLYCWIGKYGACVENLG
jgi:hypothetical protein